MRISDDSDWRVHFFLDVVLIRFLQLPFTVPNHGYQRRLKADTGILEVRRGHSPVVV